MEGFYNYEYRHLLRSVADYQQFKGLKKAPSATWFEQKLRKIKNEFQRFGLPFDGFTQWHTEIIARSLGLSIRDTIAKFHPKPKAEKKLTPLQIAKMMKHLKGPKCICLSYKKGLQHEVEYRGVTGHFISADKSGVTLWRPEGEIHVV